MVALAAGTARAAERDAKADAIGREMIAAMGGEEAWEKARQFRFDFVVMREGKQAVSRSHAWDRYTGDYRVAGTDRNGVPFTVYFNVNTREGKAFSGGKPAEGEAEAALLKSAYGMFINDTYWLLAPWKIFDPGVHLTYDGEKPCPDGGACDVLKLSFENVGLTPRDLYWLYVTRDGHQMVQWQYVLNGSNDPPTVVPWKDWHPYGGIMLATEKPMAGKPVVIRFENLSVSATRDDALFHP
jgi:elongation factor P hydroxylase